MQKRYSCKLKTLLKEALSFKREVGLGNLYAFLSTLTTVSVPLFIPLLIDEMLLHKEPKLTAFVDKYFMEMNLTGYVIFFFLVTILMRFLGIMLVNLQVKMMVNVSKEITYKLRVKLIEHIKRVALKEYERFSVGAITSKFVTDINTLDSFIGNIVGKVLVSSLVLIFSSIVLLIINWKLAIFIIITNPVVVYFSYKKAKSIGGLKREENRATEEFQDTLTDNLELFNQIKAVNKEDYFFNKSVNKALSLRDKSIEFGYKSDKSLRVSYFLFLAGYELFRSVSILFVAYSDLSIGFMLAIFGYLWIMAAPTNDVINFQYNLSNAKNACDRIDELFELEQEREVKQSKTLNGDIEVTLDGLNFGYEEGKEILKDLNFTIFKNKKVAIVGPSGSGKSTIANIIAGFYEPDSGDILYNNISYKELSPDTIRKKVYLILQHPKLFNDTMRFNLTLGKDFTNEEVDRALKIAQLEDVVVNLSGGLDTVVGKDGVKLSGGQRQRVAIARMILADPEVIIFDESTSALDVHTELNLFTQLQEFLRDKTVITIAHRLSTIEKAEYIYVLEDGKLVDSGKPDTLLIKDGGYFANMI